MQFSQNIRFLFWKALELLYYHESSASLREVLCDTLVDLVRECSSSMVDPVLVAQSFCLVTQMFPVSIFLDQDECDGLGKISAPRNAAVKNAALKLIQGHY